MFKRGRKMETMKLNEYMKKVDPSRVSVDNFNNTPLSHKICGKEYRN
jgi:hypothetical protein